MILKKQPVSSEKNIKSNSIKFSNQRKRQTKDSSCSDEVVHCYSKQLIKKAQNERSRSTPSKRGPVNPFFFYKKINMKHDQQSEVTQVSSEPDLGFKHIVTAPFQI
jgi:hypothetical protein